MKLHVGHCAAPTTFQVAPRQGDASLGEQCFLPRKQMLLASALSHLGDVTSLPLPGTLPAT